MTSSLKNSKRPSGESFIQSKLWMSVFVVVITLCPSLVLADEIQENLGALFCHVMDESNVYPYILSVCAYIMGAFMAVRAVLLFKKHFDNPNDSQITRGVSYFIASALLMSLPAFSGVVQRTLFTGMAGGGRIACSPGAAAGDGSAGLDVMMQNFVQNIYGPIVSLVATLSIIVGLTFIVKALLRGAKTGSDPRAADPKSIITHLIIGAVLISTGTAFGDVMQSLFGTADITNMSSYDGIAWSSITGGGDVTHIQAAVNAVLMFVQIIGLIAFMRGWLMLKTSLDGGQATVPQALTFIIGGTMAVNIDKMLSILDNTFGTNIING